MQTRVWASARKILLRFHWIWVASTLLYVGVAAVPTVTADIRHRFAWYAVYAVAYS